MKLNLVILLGVLLFASCSNEDPAKTAPEIPPVETMVIDFGRMADTNKSASVSNTNWAYSAINVGVWSGIIGTTFAIPVAAFRSAVGHQPVDVGDLTWQWEYTVEGFTSQYSARLVGAVESVSTIKWEMYVTKTGINPFNEFLWFEGTSNMDGNSGQWVLYHSSAMPEKTIQIDWKKENDKVGEIKYTYVREKNDQRQPEKFKGSTLTYGLQNAELDIFVNIHAFDFQSNLFNDTNIEWSRTKYNGRVKSELFFKNPNWHCWDSQGADVDCN